MHNKSKWFFLLSLVWGSLMPTPSEAGDPTIIRVNPKWILSKCAKQSSQLKHKKYTDRAWRSCYNVIKRRVMKRCKKTRKAITRCKIRIRKITKQCLRQWCRRVTNCVGYNSSVKVRHIDVGHCTKNSHLAALYCKTKKKLTGAALKACVAFSHGRYFHECVRYYRANVMMKNCWMRTKTHQSITIKTR